MHTQPDLLQGLSEADAQNTLALGARINVSSGEELFQLGSRADNLFVIERGRIKLTLPIRVRGHEESIFVEERVPGQTVGWSALIPPYRFTLQAIAQLETEVIALPSEALRSHFADHPEVGHVIALNLAAIIGQRLQIFQAMWLREIQRTVQLCGA